MANFSRGHSELAMFFLSDESRNCSSRNLFIEGTIAKIYDANVVLLLFISKGLVLARLEP